MVVGGVLLGRKSARKTSPGGVNCMMPYVCGLYASNSIARIASTLNFSNSILFRSHSQIIAIISLIAGIAAKI